jgi:nitrate reductase gamma subunit
MKIMFWSGLVLLIIGFFAGFLSGATNNGQPIVSFIYKTNQVLWLFMAVVGAILLIIGAIGLIIRAVKNRRQPPKQTP